MVIKLLSDILTLFGSPGAVGIIVPLCRTGIEMSIKLFKQPSKKEDVFRILYGDFLMIVEETAMKFGRHVSRETAAEYVEEKTAHILKKLLKKPWVGIKKKKKQPDKDVRRPDGAVTNNKNG